jgi:hypothetical protein
VFRDRDSKMDLYDDLPEPETSAATDQKPILPGSTTAKTPVSFLPPALRVKALQVL